MNAEMKAKLEKIAQRKCWTDLEEGEEYPDIDGYAGGNIDDAYSGGTSDGETCLARELLEQFGGA